MFTTINVLMIEDSEDDALLILRELRRGGFSVEHRRVETAKSMQAALQETSWDVIISDYNLPGFSGLAALRLAKQSGLDIPFFLVSGAIGEEIAVDAMQSGAQDYIKKDNLTRLIPAIQRELRVVEVRQDRAQVKEKLQDSEIRYRTLVENIPIGLFRSKLSSDAFITMANIALAAMFGFDSVAEITQQQVRSLFLDEFEFQKFMQTLNQNHSILANEIQLKRKDGEPIWVSITARTSQFASEQIYFDCTIEDIRSRKHSEKLKDALYRISQSANTSRNLEALVRAVHKIIGELMPANNFYLALYDKSTQMLSFPYFVDQYDATPAPQIINNGLTSYVIRSGRPLLARPEVTRELIASHQVESNGSPSLDWLGVPLKTASGETIGALVLQTYSEGVRYSEYEQEVLTFVSDQLGAVVERKRADEALSVSDARQRALLEAIPDMIFVLDTTGYIVDCKIPVGTRFLLNAKDLVARPMRDLLPSDVFIETFAALKRVLESGVIETVQVEWREFRNRTQNYEVRLARGNPGQVTALVRDVTETFEVEKRLEQQRLFLRQVIDINPNLIFAKDQLGKFTLANQAQADAYGTTVEKLIGQTDEMLQRPSAEVEINRINDLQVIETLTELVISEEKLLDASGNIRWLQTVRRPIILADQSDVQVLGVSTDISERKNAEDKMLHNAFYDALTGLPNRVMVLKLLDLSIAQYRVGAITHPGFLVMLDLDQFAVVNDSLGYQVGDSLLIFTAQRIRSILGDADILARTGGDEFVVLLGEIRNQAKAVELVETLIDQLHLPFQIGNHRVVTTISIGLVVGINSYDKPENILRDADIALHRAKGMGRGRYTIFDDVMRSNVVARLELENDLRHAIVSNQMEVYFEPIISLKTGKALSFESLLRWNHPERGLVMPGAFISFAEETGLIVPLGKWILYEVCRLIRKWEDLYPWTQDVVIAVNISGKQFAQPDIVDVVRDALAINRIRADRIRLEITESVLMERPDLAINALNELQKMGVKIFIDDFGTGYSSLYYLHNLPLNAIKVDRSFISGRDRIKSGNEIVNTIVRLANELQLETVAEGVETVEQLKWMMNLKLDYVQGFLFFNSLGTEDFESFLKARKIEVDWISSQFQAFEDNRPSIG